QQGETLLLPVPGHERRIELVECDPVALPFLEDRLPTQSRLRPFEDQDLEKEPVVPHRHSPFLIVVLHVEFGPGPRAAAHFNPRHGVLGSHCFFVSPPAAHVDRPASRGARAGVPVLTERPYGSHPRSSNALCGSLPAAFSACQSLKYLPSC